jgi:hypothetical protein
MYAIRIDDEILTFSKVSTGGYLPLIRDGRREWHITEDSDAADAATLRYWQEMDAREVVALVGEKRIVEMWSTGTSLEEFAKEIPASEQWASYDGNESDVEPPTDAERETAAREPSDDEEPEVTEIREFVEGVGRPGR